MAKNRGIKVKLQSNIIESIHLYKQTIFLKNKFVNLEAITILWHEIKWTILVSRKIITWTELYFHSSGNQRSMIKCMLMPDKSLWRTWKDWNYQYSLYQDFLDYQHKYHTNWHIFDKLANIRPMIIVTKEI